MAIHRYLGSVPPWLWLWIEYLSAYGDHGAGPIRLQAKRRRVSMKVPT